VLREIYRRSADRFTSGKSGHILKDLPEGFLEEIPTVVLVETTPALASADPPLHTRQRALFHRSLTPRRLAAHREWITKIADELATDLARQRGECDLLAQYTQPLAYAAILGLFGAPLSHVPIYREVADSLFSFKGYGAAGPLMERARRYERALVALRGALESIYDLERAREPGETILSTLLQPADAELSSEELFGILTLFFGAASDNLIYSPAIALLELLRHPAQFALVKADPEMAGPAYEESLRWESAVHVNSRIAASDLELAGQHVHAGDRMLLIKAAANRDPAVWSSPHQFDIRRDQNEAPGGHLAFGQGIHFCIGSGIARLVGPVAINVLVKRFPSMMLAGDWSPSWGEVPLTRRLADLRVVLRGTDLSSRIAPAHIERRASGLQ
jgi:cytochrome P450